MNFAIVVSGGRTLTALVDEEVSYKNCS